MEHCENCGGTESLNGDQGYTACCNEPVCDGSEISRWVLARSWDDLTPVRTVSACCGGKAQELAAREGLVAFTREG